MRTAVEQNQSDLHRAKKFDSSSLLSSHRPDNEADSSPSGFQTVPCTLLRLLAPPQVDPSLKSSSAVQPLLALTVIGPMYCKRFQHHILPLQKGPKRTSMYLVPPMRFRLPQT